MIVTINGKDTWRPNFVRTRKSETCREFFTEIYGVDFYGCDDYGLPESEMAKLADAIKEEFFDAAVYIENENEVRRPAYTMERLWDEIYKYIDSACRTGVQVLSR